MAVGGGAASLAFAAVLAISLGGCNSGPRSAGDCRFQLRVASLGVADAPVPVECHRAPPVVDGGSDPSAGGGVVPLAASETPPDPPEVDPKLFVPSG